MPSKKINPNRNEAVDNNSCTSKIKRILVSRRTAHKKIEQSIENTKKELTSDKDILHKINAFLENTCIPKPARWNKKLSIMSKSKEKMTTLNEKVKRLASIINDILVHQTTLETRLNNYYDKAVAYEKKTQKFVEETLAEVKEIRVVSTNSKEDVHQILQSSLFKPSGDVKMIGPKYIFQRQERKKSFSK